MQRDAIEVIKMAVDPRQLLGALGFTIFMENNKELRGPCAIHGGDNKTAFCFLKDTKRFYCFSHGCERDENGEIRNDIIDLVMRKKQCSFTEAVTFLANLTGIDLESIEDIDGIVEKKKRDYEHKQYMQYVYGMEYMLPEINRSVLEVYKKKGCPYFESMGVPAEIISKFELGTMTDKTGVVRAAIPIFDDVGRLVGISGRRVDGDAEPRYLLTSEFNKRYVLYGLNLVVKLPFALRSTVILVEGFKALWYVYSLGFKNVAALMGRVIRTEQINLLVKHGVNNTLLLLDGDVPGKEGTETSLKLMHGIINSTPITLPDGKSPDDIPKEELKELLELFLV